MPIITKKGQKKVAYPSKRMGSPVKRSVLKSNMLSSKSGSKKSRTFKYN